MDLNKSSVPQYCILFRLILQVARFSIAFYFVNISLVPVHSPLSILPGPAQCGLWFQFGDSALRTEGSSPDPSQWNEGRRQTLSNLSEYHGTLAAQCLSVSHRRLATASSVPSAELTSQCQHYHLSSIQTPSSLNYSGSPVSEAVFRQNTLPPPSLYHLSHILAQQNQIRFSSIKTCSLIS